jgi:hypothetical protein
MWVCPKCRHYNYDTDDTCDTCKAKREVTNTEYSSEIVKKQDEKISIHTPPQKRGEIMIECPKCHSDEFIQKVSAVYSAGTGSYSAPSTTVVNVGGKWGTGVTFASGQTTTQLASKVAPPIEPLKPSHPFKYYLGWICTIIFFLPLCYMIVLVPGNYPGECLSVSIIILIVGIINIFFGSSEQKERLTIFEQEHQNWKRLIAQWDRMYYCHKHDIMFDPENGDIFTFTRRT